MEILLILHIFLVLFLSIKQCEKITKEGTDQGVVSLTYYVTQTDACVHPTLTDHVFMYTLLHPEQSCLHSCLDEDNIVSKCKVFSLYLITL